MPSIRTIRLNFEALAASAGTVGVGLVLASRPRPDPKYFVGSGKAEEIRACAEEHRADLVLVDQTLSPSQERNLEKLTDRRVLDRNGLILDIFAQRARSFEGKLQVELAQLSHLATRLVRGWTPPRAAEGRYRLARTRRNAIGNRPAPHRQSASARCVRGWRSSTVSARPAVTCGARCPSRPSRLVGYTNAGKSTLFNALTGSATYVADQLFATLDPTVRQIKLSGVGEVVLADTVGFVAGLPHELVAAFRSTLQEARDADLLLHVVDASDPMRNERIEQVREVLRGIGAGEIRELLVFNKIDLEPRETCDRVVRGCPTASRLRCGSRRSRAPGLRSCAKRSRGRCGPTRFGARCTSNGAAAVRSALYRRNAVRAERQYDDGSWELDVELDATEIAKLAWAEMV